MQEHAVGLARRVGVAGKNLNWAQGFVLVFVYNVMLTKD